MKQDSHNILIQRHLDGESSATEDQTLKNWRAKSEENEQEFQAQKELIGYANNIDFNFNPKTEIGWQKLENQLGLKSGKIVKMSPMGRILRIAAIFVGLVAVGFLAKNMLTETPPAMAQEIFVQKGETKTVNLPDGSIVQINSDSKLTIQPEFGQNNRNLTLEGEAYFEVSKNKDLPFVIQTGKVNTKVVGTAFNLTAYPNNTNVEISVTEGVVEFNDEDEIVKLTANKSAKFDKQTGKIQEIPFEQNNLKWKEGELVFEEVAFEEILKSLERKFNVQIENNSSLGSTELSDYVSSNDSLEDILSRLKMVHNFEFQKEDNKYIIQDK